MTEELKEEAQIKTLTDVVRMHLAETEPKFPSVSVHNLILILTTRLNLERRGGPEELKQTLTDLYAEREPSKLYLEVCIAPNSKHGVTLVQQVPDLSKGLEPLSGGDLANLVCENLPLIIPGQSQNVYVRSIVESFRNPADPQWKKTCKYSKAFSAYIDRKFQVRLMFERDVESVKKMTKD